MHNIQAMARCARIIGAVLTIVTVGITARFGWLQGEDAVTSFCYAIGLGSASFLVGYGLVFAWAAYKLQLPRIIVASAVFVFFAAVGVELMSHLGATASARSHSMTQASEQTTRYADTRANLEAARAELATLKTTPPAAAIEASMAGLRQRVGWERTNGCSNVGGYPTLCRQYAGLSADLGIAKRRDELHKQIAAGTAATASSSAGHSAAAAQSTALAQYATLSIRPSADDAAKTNMGIQLWLALYFVAIGLVNLIAHALEDHAQAPDPAPATAEVITPEFGRAISRIEIGKAIMPRVA
jgi:hypothetical protein